MAGLSARPLLVVGFPVEKNTGPSNSREPASCKGCVLDPVFVMIWEVTG